MVTVTDNRQDAFELITNLDYPAVLDGEERDRVWRESRAGELPPPVAAIWFQCALDLPGAEAWGVLGAACLPFSVDDVDGVDDVIDLAARLAHAAVDLEESLLHAQMGYYIARYVKGEELAAKIARVQWCFDFLGEWHEASRNLGRLRLVVNNG